jgi:hypothetical protein
VGCLLNWSAIERIGDKEKSFARLPKDASQNYLFFCLSISATCKLPYLITLDNLFENIAVV